MERKQSKKRIRFIDVWKQIFIKDRIFCVCFIDIISKYMRVFSSAL